LRLRLICILLVVSAVFVTAAETPIPPAPTRFVTDTAGFLSPAAAEQIDHGLAQFERDTGHQMLVYIGQTTGDAPIDDWAVRAFEKWKVGRQGLDDGAVLFIMAQDRRLRIEVGYGLEGQIPDALAGRIINEFIVPKIQTNDRDGAVTAGVNAMVSAVSGQGLPASGTARRNVRSTRALSLGEKIVFGVVGLFVLIMLATNPSLAIWLLMSMMSGGGRRSRGGWDGGGGGGWGGGGFSGGGGRSGGGGASGSW
jgi:uncharacterized protein